MFQVRDHLPSVGKQRDGRQRRAHCVKEKSEAMYRAYWTLLTTKGVFVLLSYRETPAGTDSR